MTGCYGPKYAECNNMTSGVYWAIHSAVSWHISDNREVMTSWSSLTVTCAMCSALSIVRQAIFEPSWHITWLLVYRGPLAMKTVIWPSSADRFLSPSPLPSPSSLYFSFISLGCGPAGTWREELGKDGSSAQCKSLPPGKPASDARPHGPLTCCLPWFIAAFCLWPLQTLSPPYPFRSHTHCTTVYRGIQRGIPCTCRAEAQARIHPLLPTLSHAKIITYLNISTLQHRVLQSHHMSIRRNLLPASILHLIVCGSVSVMVCQL